MHLDDYLLCSITSERKLMNFITDRNGLMKCGMESRYVNKEMNANILNRPLFMTVESHILHKEYTEIKTLMRDQTGGEFVARIHQKVEREPSDERKTRMKCKYCLLTLFAILK